MAFCDAVSARNWLLVLHNCGAAVMYDPDAGKFLMRLPSGEEVEISTGGGGDISAAWPIGSVFTSVVATSPATLLGFGTWISLGAGRVLVGVDPGDPDFDTPGETGGAKTVAAAGSCSAPTFTGSALGTHSHGTGTYATSAHSGTAVNDHASHTHAYTDVINHTHTVNVTDGGHNHTQNSHNHTQDAHTHTQNSHNHTQDAHTHTQNAHNHVQNTNSAASGGLVGSTPDPSTNTSVTSGYSTANATAVNQNATATNQAATATNQNATATNQAATATNQSSTTGITAATVNPGGGVASGTTAGPSATLTHSVTQPSAHTLSGSSEAVSAGTPAGSVSAPTFTGSPTSIVQPYFCVYFWQRVA